jgi:ABC-type uncharacterized transport system ATPase subunit
MSASPSTPLLALDDISLSFKGVKAVTSISFSVAAGEICALIGPNGAGKSSLLNALAGAELAIVTPIPGTTRDKVSETIQIQGVPLHVVDTAGLREAGDEVERIGIARSDFFEAALLHELRQPDMGLAQTRPRHLLVSHEQSETVRCVEMLCSVRRDTTRQIFLLDHELSENGVADGAVVTTTIPCVSPRKHALRYRDPPTEIERAFDLPT